MTKRLSDRKTLGTGFNLRPRTERVPAWSLEVGDVVLESLDTPARTTRVLHDRHGTRIWARFIWQAEREPDWLLGIFDPYHPFDRAKKGEY